MGRKFENILETVGNTPIVRIGKLAPPGVNLFVKIEAFNPLGSVRTASRSALSKTPSDRESSNRGKQSSRLRAATPE